MKKDEFTSLRKTGKQEIQNYTYQFTNQYGNYVIIDRYPILQASEISTIQRKMIESNKIPRHLSLEIREIDYQIKLFYRIGHKKMLSTRLKAEGLTMNHGIQLLCQLIMALQDSKNYMFDHSNYLLDIDFVFMGEEADDIFLTYVPLKNQRTEYTLPFQWIHLLRQLEEFSTHECKHFYEEIIRLCSHSFSLDQCKHFLLEYPLKKEHILHQTDRKHTTDELLLTPTSSTHINPMQVMISEYGSPKPVMKEQKPIEEKSTEEKSTVQSTTEQKSTEQEILKFIPLTFRIKMMVSLCAILFLIIVWKLVIDSQGGSFIYVGSGLTLLIVSFWMMISLLGFPNVSNPRNIFRRFPKKSELRINKQPDPLNHNPIRISDDSIENVENLDNEENVENLDNAEDCERYYQQLPLKTTLIRKDHDHTTILSQSDLHSTLQGEENKQQKAFIIYRNNGEQVNVLINQDVFRIGRGKKEVDLMINDSGVSRVHAEIIKTTEGYVLKDLNSKNGLMLNDLSLIPYQSYELVDGDMICMVRNELIFRIY